MFEGLIEFIEKTLFSLYQQAYRGRKKRPKRIRAGRRHCFPIARFCEENPGMTRVLIGDALVNENDRLQIRINQLHDRLEATLKQALRFAVSEKEISADLDISAQANLLMCYVAGRWHQFAKSGFKRDPMEYWEGQRSELFSHKASSVLWPPIESGESTAIYFLELFVISSSLRPRRPCRMDPYSALSNATPSPAHRAAANGHSGFFRYSTEFLVFQPPAHIRPFPPGEQIRPSPHSAYPDRLRFQETGSDSRAVGWRRSNTATCSSKRTAAPDTSGFLRLVQARLMAYRVEKLSLASTTTSASPANSSNRRSSMRSFSAITFDFRIDAGESFSCGIRFGDTNTICAVSDLPLKIGQVNRIAIANGQLGHSACGQIHRGRRAQATRADYQYMRLDQSMLPVMPICGSRM